MLKESGDEIGIFGAVVGPDRQKVLARGGNAANLVLEPSSGRRIKLPQVPPGLRMLGFGQWHWIGPNALLGVAGVEKILHKGPHENCCNDDNVAQTKFYVFNLFTEKLSEVVMPYAVTQPVVNSVSVTNDGFIRLSQDGLNDRSGQDLGWFKIHVPE